MRRIRRSGERGHFNFGWLDTYHTFSFGEYHDPQHMGFRSLRVLNEDRLAAGQGFPEHGHRDMEILSYVLSGELEHQDSLGNGSVIQAGDVQVMSAGTGVQHSEKNPSAQEPVHFIQVWIIPSQRRLTPGYQQKHVSAESRTDQFRLIASTSGDDGSLVLHQDARVYVHTSVADTKHEFTWNAGRFAWIQVLRGEITINDQSLLAGDGIAFEEETSASFQTKVDTDLLIFDLA